MTKPATALLLALGCAAASTGCSRRPSDPPKEAPEVVFTGADGRTLAMDELHSATGAIRYETAGKSRVPVEADALHEQARRVGSSGDHKQALLLLERSSKLAPEWPYPVYDMAFTYLQMKDTENARKYYRRTVELSPRGFFTAITALDALDREDRHELPSGTYLDYLSTEWIEDRAKKVESVRRLVERTPDFAPGWSDYASLLSDDAEKLAAIDKGLAANPDAETKGILEINKALVLDRKGDHDGAVRLLGEIALDPRSTYASERMAKATLAYVAGK